MTESYESPALRSMFASLVQKAGKGPAVVAAIKETTGRQMSPATLTKIVSGENRFDWNLAFQIEDIAGEYPITAMLNARRSGDCEKSKFAELAESVMKELGDIAPALFHAATTGNFEKFAKESPEARSALEALEAFVRTQQERGA